MERSGQEKFGTSGSMVVYIEKPYRKEKLFTRLKFTYKQDALKFFGVSEEQLIKNWKDSF